MLGSLLITAAVVGIVKESIGCVTSGVPIFPSASGTPAVIGPPLSGKDARVEAFRQKLQTASQSSIAFGIGGEYRPGRIRQLKAMGLNSIRLWGVDQLTAGFLSECKGEGVIVFAGIWLGTAYETTPSAVAQTISNWINAPNADVIGGWIIGNEVETRSPAQDVFNFVERAAQAARQLPNFGNRIIGVAVAELGNNNAGLVTSLCPSVDVLVVNTYSSAGSIYTRLAASGFNGYFALGEYGLRGQWDAPRSPWGTPLEQSSTEKGAAAASAFLDTVVSGAPPPLPYRPSATGPKCIGSYLFFGGTKNEGSPLWYSIYDSAGEAVSDRIATESRLWRALGGAMAQPTAASNWPAMQQQVKTTMAGLRDPVALGALQETDGFPHVISIQAVSPANGALLYASPVVNVGNGFNARLVFSSRASSPAGATVTYTVMRESDMGLDQWTFTTPQPIWRQGPVPAGNQVGVAINEPGSYRLFAYVRKPNASPTGGLQGYASASMAFRVV